MKGEDYLPDTATSRWTRRTWLTQNITALVVIPGIRFSTRPPAPIPTRSHEARGRSIAGPLETREALAQRAVDTALRAGAQYADARLTRTEQHKYYFGDRGLTDAEEVGIGVRALVNGYWGFAALPSGDTAASEQLARQAVAQATVNARGAVPRVVDLGQIPVAAGRWSTPIAIDPFTISIEEKQSFIRYWQTCAEKVGLRIDDVQSELHFVRQERVVATSTGGRFTQTVFESGGTVILKPFEMGNVSANLLIPLQGLETTALGWELFLNARIPEQIQSMPERFVALNAIQKKTRQMTVGRYTLVCDGATMAALLQSTLGVATQLDRALGYEANAGGTSFLDDPLGMTGTFQVASPLVTVTANRTAPAQLATVRWDEEGVEPRPFTLVKDGVLVDFQTTREQAAWLAPYYQKIGRPPRSNGCAAAESALKIPLQHMPNLTLEPNSSDVRVDDLVANVHDGLLLERGEVTQVDQQARNGLLFSPQMRKIQNGKLGPVLRNGAVWFNTIDLWKHVTAIGGGSSCAVVPFSQYPVSGAVWRRFRDMSIKGEPWQCASHSVRAAAATIVNQPLIDPLRKA